MRTFVLSVLYSVHCTVYMNTVVLGYRYSHVLLHVLYRREGCNNINPHGKVIYKLYTGNGNIWRDQLTCVYTCTVVATSSSEKETVEVNIRISGNDY